MFKIKACKGNNCLCTEATGKSADILAVFTGVGILLIASAIAKKIITSG